MKIIFKPKNEMEAKAADRFIAWLSNSGEQDYWTAMEWEDAPQIVRFGYSKENEIDCEVGEKEEVEE